MNYDSLENQYIYLYEMTCYYIFEISVINYIFILEKSKKMLQCGEVL